jgi:hypothetical protein
MYVNINYLAGHQDITVSYLFPAPTPAAPLAQPVITITIIVVDAACEPLPLPMQKQCHHLPCLGLHTNT